MHWPLTLPHAHAADVDALALGENSLDFVGVGPTVRDFPHKASLSSFREYVGGQAATAAAACARQGIRTRYVGAFGDDAFARTVRASLERAGVDVVAVERRGVSSRAAMILVDEATGERSVLERFDPALALAASDLPDGLLDTPRVLILDATHPGATIAAMTKARQRGIPTIVDVDRVSPEAIEILSRADVIVVPHALLGAWGWTPGAALETILSEFKAPVAVATLGADGSLARIGTHEIRTPAYGVPVVDTTGAGDAFRGGLASGWLTLGDGSAAADILAWANATAALNCRAVGAQTGLPTRAEVEALVTRGPDGRSN